MRGRAPPGESIGRRRDSPHWGDAHAFPERACSPYPRAFSRAVGHREDLMASNHKGRAARPASASAGRPAASASGGPPDADEAFALARFQAMVEDFQDTSQEG